MTLPQDIVVALSSPSSHSWNRILDWLDDGQTTENLRSVKHELSMWPMELPRQPMKRWLQPDHSSLYKPLLGLCLDVKEVDTYPLYIAALASEPRLRLHDGSPAVSLHRQQRGVVETATGAKVTLNGDVPGMADLGGTLTLEWKKWYGGRAGDPWFTWLRMQVYIEVEVKLDSKIPPQAREYRGASRRRLTSTEEEQVQRQQAQLVRGGFYMFADRVSDAVEAVVAYRDELLKRIAVG